MKNNYVLDASAVIAYLQQEKGADVVGTYLDNASISSVNACEVASYMVRSGGEVSSAADVLKSLPINIQYFDFSQALHAADLQKQTTKFGLSLGDRACLALAEKLKATVVTADKIWAKLKLGLEVVVVR